MSKNNTVFGDLFKINKPVTVQVQKEPDYYVSVNARRRRQTNSPSNTSPQNTVQQNNTATPFDNSYGTSYTNNKNDSYGFNLWQQPVYKPKSFEEQRQKNEQLFSVQNNSYASSKNAPQKQTEAVYTPSYGNTDKHSVPKVSYVDTNIARGMKAQAEYKNYLSGISDPKSEYRKNLEKYMGRDVSETELNAYMRHPLNLTTLKREYEEKDKPKKSGRIQNAVKLSNPVYTEKVIPSPVADYDITDAYKVIYCLIF